MHKTEEEYNNMYWQKVVGNEVLKINLKKLKCSVADAFKDKSDNYKQKLVYNLLDAIRNKDQNRFFNILLKTINNPKENYKELWHELEKNYDIMPEEAFINFAYTVILGIMSSYGGSID